MGIQDWLDEDTEDMRRERERARDRAQSAGQLKNVFSRKEIGGPDQAVVVWLLTKKFGEVYRHSLGLPNGKFTIRNCCAGLDQQDNAIQLCPFHAYVVAGGGRSEYGPPQLQHEYFFIGLAGKLTKKIIEREVDGKIVEIQRDVVRWLPEPMVVAATPPMARGLLKWAGNREFPPGADGDITRYAFKLWKVTEKVAKGKDQTRYKVDYYPDVKERPTHAFHPETNERVEINLDVARSLYDQIVSECRPTTREMLQAILDSARASATDPTSAQAAPGEAPASRVEGAAAAPADAASGLSSAHAFEDDEVPTTGSAIRDDEKF